MRGSSPAQAQRRGAVTFTAPHRTSPRPRRAAGMPSRSLHRPGAGGVQGSRPVNAYPPDTPPKSSRPWWHFAVLGCGSLLLLGLVVVGGAAYWFGKNKDKLLAMGKEA